MSTSVTTNPDGPYLPSIFLRFSEETLQSVLPSKLARLFRLDVFGTSLLTRRAGMEMNLAASILSLIFLFEGVVWSCFFHAVFYSDITLPGLKTIPACALGFTYALLIVLFDRLFFIEDWTYRPSRTTESLATTQVAWLVAQGLKIVIRAGIILLSAIAVGAVIDLILFQQPIERRIQEENLRWYLVAFAADLDFADPARIELNQSLERQQLQENLDHAHEQKLSILASIPEVVKEQTLARVALENIHDEIARLNQKIRQLQGTSTKDVDPNDPRDEAPEDKGRNLEHQLITARSKERRLESEFAAATTRVETSRTELEAVETTIISIQKSLQEETARRDEQRKRYLDAFNYYRATGDNDDFLELLQADLGAKAQIEPPRPDVFERYRMLLDLATGRPPVWPEASASTLQQLKEAFELVEIPRCQDASNSDSNDSIPWRCRSARVYYRALILLLFVAAIVPSLALVMKIFFMPEQLKRYYSLKAQAASMNPDALLHFATERATSQSWHLG